MPGNDANTKLLLHANAGHGVKTAFLHIPFHNSGTGTSAILNGSWADDGNNSMLGNRIASDQATAGKAANGLFDTLCAFFPSNGYFNFPDHADWDLAGSNADNWTVDFWIRFYDHAGTETILDHYEDGSNHWRIEHTDGQGWRLRVRSGAVNIIDMVEAGEITDQNWHHVALCKVANEYAIYVDGSQVTYTQDSDVDTFAGLLWIGSRGDTTQKFHGFLEELRIQNSNPFSAAPNASFTDTITLPTSEHTSDANTHLLMHFNGNLTDSGNTVHTVNTTVNTMLGAYDFNGTNDFIREDTGTSIPDILSDTIGSYAVWVKPTNFSATYNICSVGANATDDYWSMNIDTTGKLRTGFIDSGTNQWTVDSNTTLTSGVWTHIVFVQDGISPHYYINGTKDTGSFIVDNDRTLWYASNAALNNVQIGALETNSSIVNYFLGAIDDWRYYKSVLKQAEVDFLYNSGNGTEYPIINDSAASNETTPIGGPIWFSNGMKTVADAQIDESAGGLQAVPDSESFGGYASFNGSTARLEIPDHADWDLVGSNADDWTVDMWVRMNNTAASSDEIIGQRLDGNNIWYIRHQVGSGLRFEVYDTAVQVIDTGFGGEITDTEWHHVALCKVANEYAIYLDGVQGNYVQDSSTVTFAASLFVGWAGFGYWDGDMDDVRISTTNVFSAAPNVGLTDTITVPTTPAVSGAATRLLLQNDTDVTTEGGVNTHTVTNNNVTWEPGGKWNSAALKFTGIGDAVSIPDSADWNPTTNWTVDTQFVGTGYLWQHRTPPGDVRIWCNLAPNRIVSGIALSTSPGVYESLIDTQNTGNFVDDLTRKRHCAFIKVGTGYGVYIDGVQAGYMWAPKTEDQTGPFVVGGGNNGTTFNVGFTGNLDEFRIQADNYFSAAPNSFPAAPLLMYGEALTKSYGIFDGSTTYITAPDSTDWDLVGNNTESWTIDLWVNSNNAPTISEYLVHQGTGAGDRWFLYLHATYGISFSVNMNGGALVFNMGASSTEVLTPGTWNHVALVKVASDWGLYLNGQQVKYVSDSGTATSTGLLYIGEAWNGNNHFDGLLDEIRIQRSNAFSATPGAGLTDTITVPDGIHTSDSNTSLLVHFDAGSAINDVSPSAHTLTVNAVTRELANEGYGDNGVHSDNGIDGLVNGGIERHHFKFEETSGTTVTSIAGALTTITASTDASNLTATGKIGNGFEFDGTESINANNLETDIGSDTSGTVCFWFKTTDTSAVYFGTGTTSHTELCEIRATVNGRVWFNVTTGSTEVASYQSPTGYHDDAWHHCAVVQDGVKVKMYLDGSEVTLNELTTTTPGAWFGTVASNVGSIAYRQNGGAGEAFYTGSLDDFRYYRNMALSQFQINKIYNDGDGTHNKLHALFFNGSTDYVTVTDTSGTDYDIAASSTDSWTIDLWVKHTDHVGTETYIDQYESTAPATAWRFTHLAGTGLRFVVDIASSTIIQVQNGGEITDTAWHHVALVKSGSHWGNYLDGVQVAYTNDSSTGTVTGSLNIGRAQTAGGVQYFAGYMEQVQITKGNKFGVVPAVLRADMESTTANTGQTITLGGTAAISTADKQFGTSSLLLDGNSDYATVPDSADFDFGTNDFTIEMWVNWNDIASTTRQPFYMHDNIADGNDWVGWRYIDSTSQFQFFVYVGTVLQVNMTPTTWLPVNGTWYHIAVVRSSGTFTLYADGVVIDTYSGYSGAMPNPTGTLMIGASDTEADYLGGYIDEVKVYNGWAKYTGAFTRPPDPGEDFSG